MNNKLPPMRSAIPEKLRVRLRRVRLLLCDVDGVLTDGTVVISGRGDESKRFSIRDGQGLVLVRWCGIRVGWISSRPSPATTRRARELKVDFLVQRKGSKVAAVEEILAQAGCSWAEVCFVGDDLVDLGPLRRAGVGVAVADAEPEARAAARAVTRAAGGEGAVREVVGWILKAQGKWDALVAEFTA